MAHSAESLTYRISSPGLDASEFQSLYDEICPEKPSQLTFCAGPSNPVLDFFIEGAFLLPIASAVGKSVLDVIKDRVEQWLSKRPEDRKVEILGPDGSVVSVVKVGKSANKRSDRH